MSISEYPQIVKPVSGKYCVTIGQLRDFVWVTLSSTIIILCTPSLVTFLL